MFRFGRDRLEGLKFYLLFVQIVSNYLEIKQKNERMNEFSEKHDIMSLFESTLICLCSFTAQQMNLKVKKKKCDY